MRIIQFRCYYFWSSEGRLLSTSGLCNRKSVGSEDFGEALNGHGETGNGPDADVEHFSTTVKKGSLSYADAARGTKRYVSFEWDRSSHSNWLITANISRILLITIVAWILSSEPQKNHRFTVLGGCRKGLSTKRTFSFSSFFQSLLTLNLLRNIFTTYFKVTHM